MLRRFLVIFCGMTLCSLVVALAVPANASSRTLHPNELWSAYGGGITGFDDRCCDQIGYCVTSMDLCDMNDNEQDCDNAEEEANPSGSYNDKGCNSGPTGTICFEDKDKVVCKYIYECVWNEMMEECGQGQQTSTKSAPKGCASDCEEEDPPV